MFLMATAVVAFGPSRLPFNARALSSPLGGIQCRQKVLEVADLLDIVLEPGPAHRLGNCFRDDARQGLKTRPFRHWGERVLYAYDLHPELPYAQGVAGVVGLENVGHGIDQVVEVGPKGFDDVELGPGAGRPVGRPPRDLEMDVVDGVPDQVAR